MELFPESLSCYRKGLEVRIPEARDLSLLKFVFLIVIQPVCGSVNQHLVAGVPRLGEGRGDHVADKGVVAPFEIKPLTTA